MQVKNLPNGAYFLLNGNLSDTNGAIWMKINDKQAICVSPPANQREDVSTKNLLLWFKRAYEIYYWKAEKVF